ncbi:MAG TPA: twin-arginine translocase subunit TatC [Pyrinomonadaceae bacterium]|nr:twin-arginine translocase subunit TatC [Pyrinomonadaceae bacterium]
MASTLLEPERADEGREEEADGPAGGQMSFLEHLDELRRRLVRSTLFVFTAFFLCWWVSDQLYNFLARPVRVALADAQRRQLPLGGLTGGEAVLPLSSLNEGDAGRYVFADATKLGQSIIPPGTSVLARVARDSQGQTGLFTDEPLFAGNTVIPKGVRLPYDPKLPADALPGIDDRLVVHTAVEPFSLYVKVSLYAAVCLSVPFLLWQIWAFVAPGLYPHERSYALPFVVLSSLAFVAGAAFAYYVIFPPAIEYLLGVGENFRLFLNAADYFDFIILIMLGMGLVFQMPAVTYVLSRIGLVSAGMLVRVWRIALVVILVAAAVLSPTADVPNMMLFAAPMMVLYALSIFVAWIFGRKRRAA